MVGILKIIYCKLNLIKSKILRKNEKKKDTRGKSLNHIGLVQKISQGHC